MFIYEKAAFPSCHASTIVEVAGLHMRPIFLAAWFGGKAEGAKDVKIYWSSFDGKSWSAPEVAAEEPNQPCWNPVLFRSQAGTLSLWYKAGPSPQTWTGYVRHSKDNGKTWSPSEMIPAGLLGPVRAKPIQLADGTILAGTSVESYKSWASYVDRSSDDGKTWTRHGPIVIPNKPHSLIQPTLFETKDGQIVAMCRSSKTGRIAQSESKDAGKTWSPARLIELPNPSAGIDAVRLTSGEIVLIYNHTPLFRFPLNLAISADDGKTWKPLKTLEGAAGEYSYPAIVQGQDGMLHCTYTWNRSHIKYVVVDPKNPG